MRTCGQLWREKARGTTSDEDEGEDEGSLESVGSGEGRSGDQPFGLAGKSQEMSTRPHSCGMGVRVAWCAPALLGKGQELPTTKGALRKVKLEVVARVAACAAVNGTWRACFKVDCALPVPAVMWPWLGKELRFQGDLEIQGYRESRRRQPSLSWSSSGEVSAFRHAKWGGARGDGLGGVGSIWTADKCGAVGVGGEVGRE